MNTVMKGALLGAGVALAAAWGAAAQAQILPKWELAGQLELAPGEVVGPLTISPNGELVAGTTLDADGRFSGRIWSTVDGLQLVQLDSAFQALLPIRFAQSAYELNVLAATVYAHGRRDLRSWSVADGTETLELEIGAEVLANEVMYDAQRETYMVSREMGGLLVYGAAGEAIDHVELDALRPHGAMALSRDGGLLVVESGDFTLSSPMAGLPYRCVPAEICRGAYGALPMSYGPYERLLAFDPLGERLATLPEIDPARTETAGTPSRTVATPTIRLWRDIGNWNGNMAPELEITGFASPVVAGAFSADGAQLLTWEEAGHLSLWDTTSGRQLFGLRAPEGDGVIAARLIPQGHGVFVHWASDVSQLYDTRQGIMVRDLPWPNAEAVVAPDGRTLITYGVGEAPARVWRRR